MNELVEIKVDDYSAAVKQFRLSMIWSYLTHRYLPAALNLLLRALTVSGLDPWEWARCAMFLVMQPESDLGRLLVETGLGMADASSLHRAVSAIQAYAAEQGEPLGEPPVAPVHLADFGSTPESYACDVEEVSGQPVDLRYLLPWGAAEPEANEAPIQSLFLSRAAALMGATAGAIEQIAALGGCYGRR